MCFYSLKRKILHLDGCQGHVVQSRKIYKEMNLLNYEIIIQKSSVVQMLGFYVFTTIQKDIRTIQFNGVAKVTGEIKVKAYLKTVVAAACNRNGTLGFGTGSITDGIHKFPVQVASFQTKDAEKLTEGSSVLVCGTVSRSGSLRVICKDISYIEVLPSENKMSESDVSKTNKPLKQWEPAGNSEALTKKRLLQESTKANESPGGVMETHC